MTKRRQYEWDQPWEIHHGDPKMHTGEVSRAAYDAARAVEVSELNRLRTHPHVVALVASRVRSSKKGSTPAIPIRCGAGAPAFGADGIMFGLLEEAVELIVIIPPAAGGKPVYGRITGPGTNGGSFHFGCACRDGEIRGRESLSTLELYQAGIRELSRASQVYRPRIQLHHLLRHA